MQSLLKKTAVYLKAAACKVLCKASLNRARRLTASDERPGVIQGEEPRHRYRIQFHLTRNNRQSVILCAAEGRNRNDVLQGFIGDESRKECAADGEKAGMPGETPRGKRARSVAATAANPRAAHHARLLPFLDGEEGYSRRIGLRARQRR